MDEPAIDFWAAPGASAAAWADRHAPELLLLALLLMLLLAVRVVLDRRARRRMATRLSAARSELQVLRGHDPVTGLAEREAFEASLAEAVAQADREGRPLCVAYLGLDGFRAINDAYGMRVGDAALAEVGRRLGEWLSSREGSRAAGGPKLPPRLTRIGGDEFALFTPAGADEAEALAGQLAQCLAAPLDVEALSLQTGLSLGLAFFPDDGARPRLLSHAALAMRSVKHTGGHGHARFDPAMAVNQRENAELLHDLRQAITRSELRLVYQPKIDGRSLQITAAEALLRWQHPKRGLVSPAVFVPLAERHGLIGSIGAWVVEEALAQAARWREKGLRMRIAINVSGLQLRAADFVDQLVAAAQRHGIPPNRLTCEITESVAMEDTPATRAAFARMRRAGLHVSIDDFGQGTSSLAALRVLQPAELKIDAAFVQDLPGSTEATSIVRTIIQLARSLQLRVVAEGVETEAQRDALVALGCDELQGYLFARPMSPTALALWAADDGIQGSSVFRPSLFEPTKPAPLDGREP
jgi:diguanylate cyclase